MRPTKSESVKVIRFWPTWPRMIGPASFSCLRDSVQNSDRQNLFDFGEEFLHAHFDAFLESGG